MHLCTYRPYQPISCFVQPTLDDSLVITDTIIMTLKCGIRRVHVSIYLGSLQNTSEGEISSIPNGPICSSHTCITQPPFLLHLLPQPVYQTAQFVTGPEGYIYQNDAVVGCSTGQDVQLRGNPKDISIHGVDVTAACNSNRPNLSLRRGSTAVNTCLCRKCTGSGSLICRVSQIPDSRVYPGICRNLLSINRAVWGRTCAFVMGPVSS